jgi:hypothetical protein
MDYCKILKEDELFNLKCSFIEFRKCDPVRMADIQVKLLEQNCILNISFIEKTLGYDFSFKCGKVIKKLNSNVFVIFGIAIGGCSMNTFHFMFLSIYLDLDKNKVDVDMSVKYSCYPVSLFKHYVSEITDRVLNEEILIGCEVIKNNLDLTKIYNLICVDRNKEIRKYGWKFDVDVKIE